MRVWTAREINIPEKVEAAWEKLSRGLSQSVPSLNEYKKTSLAAGQSMRLIIVEGDQEIRTLAPFFLSRREKRYNLGERRLLNLPIRCMASFRQTFLGDVGPKALQLIFDEIARSKESHMVDLGELELTSPLSKSVASLDWSWSRTSPSRKPSMHWFIDLPSTFDEYLSLLSSKSRKRIRRDMRIFDERLAGTWSLLKDENEVFQFLEAGEAVSRRTYQWNLGQRLVNDKATRDSYIEKARSGILRCHLLMANGKPCAFSRGTIRNRVYLYETPGFDPELAKYSPGVVLMMRVVKDLIEGTDCQIFDFGRGGDSVGYKAKYGTRSVPCKHIELVKWWRPYPFFLLAMQEGLNWVKLIGNMIVGRGKMRQKLKKAIRKYGN